jgi:glutathione S-transferase
MRWALGTCGIAATEVPLTPFFHVLHALTSGGRTTVPILEIDGRRIQDSTRILLWLDAHRGPLPLLPAAGAGRGEVLAVEARFDRVGEHVVRYAYRDTLADSESVVRYWTLDSSPFQAARIRRGFPVLRWIFRRKLWMSARNAERSREAIEGGLDSIDARLADGHRYLATDRFTLADLTAAALLAPLVCPDEHPVYGSARYRGGIAAQVAPWQKRPAFEWVRTMYREQRGSWPLATTESSAPGAAREPRFEFIRRALDAP